MQRDAQSAMEYLITYGWAILIIAVVLGVLFQLGVFSGSTFAPKAAPGLCQVYRPDGPNTTNFIATEGNCNAQLPQYVASFKSQSSGVIDTSSFIPLNKRSFTVTAWIKSPNAAQGPYDISVFGEGGTSCSTDVCMHLVIRSDTIYFGFSQLLVNATPAVALPLIASPL